MVSRFNALNRTKSGTPVYIPHHVSCTHRSSHGVAIHELVEVGKIDFAAARALGDLGQSRSPVCWALRIQGRHTLSRTSYGFLSDLSQSIILIHVCKASYLFSLVDCS